MSSEEYKDLDAKVDKIMTNHLPHLSTKIDVLSVNVDWLKKFFWVVATASITAGIASVIGLVLKLKT